MKVSQLLVHQFGNKKKDWRGGGAREATYLENINEGQNA